MRATKVLLLVGLLVLASLAASTQTGTPAPSRTIILSDIVDGAQASATAAAQAAADAAAIAEAAQGLLGQFDGSGALAAAWSLSLIHI